VHRYTYALNVIKESRVSLDKKRKAPQGDRGLSRSRGGTFFPGPGGHCEKSIGFYVKGTILINR